MDDNKYQIILDTVRLNYASVVWAHKVQEKQSDIYMNRFKWIELVNILAGTLTSCGIITIIFWDTLTLQIITAILSFVSIFVAAYYKSFDLKELQKKHKDSANHFVVERNNLLHIIEEIHLKEKTPEEIDLEYKTVMSRVNELYVEAPTTSDKALKLAEEALKINKEYTFSEEEIDNFLPDSLKGRII